MLLVLVGKGIAKAVGDGAEKDVQLCADSPHYNKIDT
jgi:hypothetical protein